MIYIDTSVLLAQLLAEDRKPPQSVWDQPLISSRLIQYEAWTRINLLKLRSSHGEATRRLLARISLLELSPLVLVRALEPFPVPVRTSDAMHLASVQYLREQRLSVSLASYDSRMLVAARRLRVEVEPL